MKRKPRSQRYLYYAGFCFIWFMALLSTSWGHDVSYTIRIPAELVLAGRISGLFGFLLFLDRYAPPIVYGLVERGAAWIVGDEREERDERDEREDGRGDELL